MMRLRNIWKEYLCFREEARRAGVFRTTTPKFLHYAILKKKYRVPMTSYFEETLYDRTRSHEAYYETLLRYIRSWKYITRKYHPNASKAWLFAHKCDYLFSKILYPGLDAMNYISYEFYNFSHEKRKTFVTEGALNKMIRSFNRSENAREEWDLLGNKAKTNKYFSRFIARRWLLTEDITSEALGAFCDGLKEVIVKPLGKCGGRGIYKVRVETPEERQKLYEEVEGKEFLLEEIIVQHPILAKLNPNSVNTYRIYTCSDGAGKVTVSTGTLRVGGSTDFVDNYRRGGYAATVDVETGIVISHAINFYGDAVYVHPYTGVQIIGTKLPEWDAAVEMVKQAHAMLSRIGYVAWDVAVCADASVTLVEANHSGGMDVQQQPMLIGVKPLYMKLLEERKNVKRK